MAYGGTVVKRRMPKARDLAPLIRFRRPRLGRAQRRLDDAQTIEDLRRLARRRTPRAAFDYTDGAAEEEISLERARQAFRDIEFHPTILRDVSNVRTGWQVLGEPVALPFAIAPTGFTRLMHTEGELAGVRVAAASRVSRFRCRRWELRPSRTSRRLRRRPASGFSSTCGVTGTGRWRWYSGPPRRASTHCWPPSTSRSRGRGYAISAMGCRFRRR